VGAQPQTPPSDTVVIPLRPMAFTLRTDEEMERALDELVKDEGLSRQEIIRRAVLDRYERAGHAKKVEDSTDRMIDRWGDVLDRLGSV
jgi:predicted transcriptional regulator